LSARIRKPVNELTREDFARYPIWKYATSEEGLEGQDETTVRPYRLRRDYLDAGTEVHLVRANFRLNSGRRLMGFVDVHRGSGGSIEESQPVITADRGQVVFWYGALKPRKRELADAYERLGVASASQVFPLKFCSDPKVRIRGGGVSGELQSFRFLHSLNPWRVKGFQ
jgi:hypothetical protein